MSKVYKNTGSLDELILSGLETEEDIKTWLTVSLEEFIEDGDIDTFYSSINYAIIAKEKIATLTKRKANKYRNSLNELLNEEKRLHFETIIKLIVDLGYSLKVA